MPEFDYDDSFPTCVETYATLRVFSDTLSPEEITKELQIEPTKSFRKGEVHNLGRSQRKTNGWFYCTKALCDSKDTRRHVDLILAVLDGKMETLQTLRETGCKLDINNYWVSTGQGGPWLMPQQMLMLGALGLSIWWDVYFDRQASSEEK